MGMLSYYKINRENMYCFQIFLMLFDNKLRMDDLPPRPPSSLNRYRPLPPISKGTSCQYIQKIGQRSFHDQ